MTELQKKEFELLELFVSICNQLGLRYYLVCGSALGSVKYKGFIPWDDDVDVALPRPDYERFLAECPAIIPSWVFVQNYRTDREYPGMGSKLRNVNTTFIEKEALQIKMNHGIFIDVFPLDGYPESKEEQKFFERKKWSYYRRRYTALIPPIHRDLGLTALSLARRYLGVYSESYNACKCTEELFLSNPVYESKLWCNFANSMKKLEYLPKDIYGDGVKARFEGMEVVIPEKYDEYLKIKYGNYKLDPPENERIPSHAYIVDVNKPYTEYLKEL